MQLNSAAITYNVRSNNLHGSTTAAPPREPHVSTSLLHMNDQSAVVETMATMMDIKRSFLEDSRVLPSGESNFSRL